MGRHSKDDVLRVGPMLWACFLQRHFRCSSLAPLNAQLLWPVTPFEAFEFGENPPPLPLRLAPKIFEQAQNLGRNPDGAYTHEIAGPDLKSGKALKFNLYERVTQRVPESKYWLLKELEPFLRADPPPIDTTVTLLRRLLEDLKLALVEARVVAAWKYLDEASLRSAEIELGSVLYDGELPEYVALTFALCHLCVWHAPPRADDWLSNGLLALCPKTVVRFLCLLEFYGLNIDQERRRALMAALIDSVDAIGARGARSLSAAVDGDLPHLADHLVLVPDTETTRRAILCLREAVHLQIYFQYPWPDFGRRPADEIETKPEKTSGLQPIKAARQLAEAAALVPEQLQARAKDILAGYESADIRRRHGSRNCPTI